MRALVLLMASVGLSLIVFWFWREQMRGRVEATPPFVAQLERLVSAGVLGGKTPESIVATLVLSDPFQEADPWDTAPKDQSTMNAWFGEPRDSSFIEALVREERTVGWRLASNSAGESARAEAQVRAAANWAAEKGVRLRVIAHGGAIIPVMRAALAAPQSEPPLFERVLGVGVRLADINARDPGLAKALFARQPVAQWLNLYSDPAVVPRTLMLERVGPGLEVFEQETAWPGRSWVPTVASLSRSGVPESVAALPTAAPGAMMSARQFRSVKDGKLTQRVMDGKGQVVTGSLMVPKLDREEIPPDPEAEEKKGVPGLIPIPDTGWNFRVPAGMTPAHTDFSKCGGGNCYLLQQHPFQILLSVDKKSKGEGSARFHCNFRKQAIIAVNHKGARGEVCKELKPTGGLDDSSDDYFSLLFLGTSIDIHYQYPPGRRQEKLDFFMNSIQALEPAVKK